MAEKKDNAKKEKINVHEGHRERMKDRFLKTDGAEDSGMQQHELLEMLLFFTIPRANTNETAHRLLSEFGSFRGVFESPFHALKNVEGVGERSAFQIRVISSIIHEYIKEPIKTSSSVDLNSPSSIVAYFRHLFFGYQNEMMYMLLFNQRGAFLDAIRVAKGTVNNAFFDERLAVQAALNRHASYVICAHNHPSGNCEISDADILATRSLTAALHAVGIALLEHYVITESSHTAIIGVTNLDHNRRINQIRESERKEKDKDKK